MKKNNIRTRSLRKCEQGIRTASILAAYIRGKLYNNKQTRSITEQIYTSRYAFDDYKPFTSMTVVDRKGRIVKVPVR
jgi:hypothetical protein